jgi:hypothetical protein
MSDLSDEAIFRMRLDVIRLNNENKELRRRLGITCNGLPLPPEKPVLAIDNVTPVDNPVDTKTVDTAVVDSSEDNDRKAYKRQWTAAKRALEKSKNHPSDNGGQG